MKNLLFMVCLFLASLACQTKNNVPAPDAGTVVAGEYQLSRVARYTNDQPDSDIKLPQTDGINTRMGTLVLARNTESTVYVSVVQTVLQVSGSPSSTTTTFGRMDVKAAGNSYELSQYNPGQQKTGTGTTNGNTINIELSDTYLTTTTRYVLEAKR